MENVFIISSFLLFYTYIGYPFVISFLSRFLGKPIIKGAITSTVSLIIAAYNEEKIIKAKLLNSTELDYPFDKLEILVASDCSTDRTDKIVHDFPDPRIKLYRLPLRGGKTAVQNFVSDFAKGEVLVFSDSSAMYDKKAIRRLVMNFADERVGCVGGRLIFSRGNSVLMTSKNQIESLDQRIKQKETAFFSTVGVDGCIYAVRKSVFEKLDPNVTSDFVEPLVVTKKGYRTVFEPEAICYEEVVPQESSEFKRKIRTVRAGLYGMYKMRSLLNPIKYPRICLCLFSHKILRWFSPFLLMICFFSNLALIERNIFTFFLGIQIIFYISALIGSRIKKTFFHVPYHFCLLSLAACVGWWHFLKGQNSEIWE